MSGQIPLVDYLVLGDQPHLVAHECTSCGARFFDRRNACASCFGTEFKHGRRRHRGRGAGVHDRVVRRPGRPGAVRGRRSSTATAPACAATSINVEPDPEHVHARHEGRLATYSVGTDDDGTEAIGFGFEPI